MTIKVRLPHGIVPPNAPSQRQKKLAFNLLGFLRNNHQYGCGVWQKKIHSAQTGEELQVVIDRMQRERDEIKSLNWWLLHHPRG